MVLACAGRTFIAGADISARRKPPQPSHLPDMVARVEWAAKPWASQPHSVLLH